MMEQGSLHLSMGQIIAAAINHHHVAKYQIHVRVPRKKIVHAFERPRQILFIAVQVGKNLPGGSPEASVDRVIHPAIFFDKRLNPRIARQPILCAIIRAGILNDMFDLDRLVSDGCDAKFQPIAAPIAWRNNRETHVTRIIGFFPPRNNSNLSLLPLQFLKRKSG
jgi:hypothetical protein